MLKKILWQVIHLLFFINPLSYWSAPKLWLLKLFGAKIGEDCTIKPGVAISSPWHLELGDYVYLDSWATIHNQSEIFIGNDVYIGKGATIHTIKPKEKAHFPVIIENDVVIEARATLYGGVICHRNSVLKINSTAYDHLRQDSIYQGNPAVRVGERG